MKPGVVLLVSLLQSTEQIFGHLTLEKPASCPPELLLLCTEREVHATPLELPTLPQPH
jgi:hypothetical protein